MQILENKNFLGTDGLGFKVERRPHAGQHSGIDRIGLGPGAMCLGKPARLQRVYLDQRKRLAKRRLECLVIWPCRLENDPRNRCLAQPFGQSTKSRSRILEALRRTIFQPEHVQVGFRNVDANGIICHLRHVLCLSCVAQSRVSVQALW